MLSSFTCWVSFTLCLVQDTNIFSFLCHKKYFTGGKVLWRNWSLWKISFSGNTFPWVALNVSVSNESALYSTIQLSGISRQCLQTFLSSLSAIKCSCTLSWRISIFRTGLFICRQWWSLSPVNPMAFCAAFPDQSLSLLSPWLTRLTLWP